MAKIVFCEDDRIIQKLIHVTMRTTAHEVYMASNGVDGLALIERERPDLVVSDVVMPELDGLSLVDTLKARPELAHIRVILLTASVERQQIEDAYRRNIDAYLAKPFKAAELREMIDRFVPNRA